MKMIFINMHKNTVIFVILLMLAMQKLELLSTCNRQMKKLGRLNEYKRIVRDYYPLIKDSMEI